MVPGKSDDVERAILAVLGPPTATIATATSADDSTDGAASGDELPVLLKLPAPETKRCPKCRANVRAGYHLCPHCQTYFSNAQELQRRLAGA
jgi:hypothetical protein